MPPMRRLFVLLICFLIANAGLDSHADESSVVARWDFDSEQTSTMTAHGSVLRDQEGPRPPEFADFDHGNTAVRLRKAGAYLSVPDPGVESRFDFSNDDPITIEAWVNPDLSRTASPVYIVGKGRTGNPRMARNNQNWALRLVTTDEATHISFLFATETGSGRSQWHRWTSDLAFPAGSGWHHVAIAYRFGDPESMAGWIDARATEGVWDMGGKTTDPPIVDDDEIWIGSAKPGNSFIGSLDAIAIHRGMLSNRVIASRFNRTGGSALVTIADPVMPAMGAIPDGRVLVTLTEGLPSSVRWTDGGESSSDQELRWESDEFLLPRIPIQHDDWGIRDQWNAPLLLRMAADVELAPGDYRFLMRVRGLSRLWVDGRLVVGTQAPSWKSVNGEQPMTPVARPPAPGARPHGYHQQEVFADITIGNVADPDEKSKADTAATTAAHRVVLETVVGGKKQRTETGEICIAFQREGSTEYAVLKPSQRDPLSLTDSATEVALARIEDSIQALDDQRRRDASASQDEFWNRRHQAARKWARQNLTATVPSSDSDIKHPIDHWIADKIDRAVELASKTDANVSVHFHSNVLPILRDHCFRCHGDKEKGGLRLNSRTAALRAGESELPAVVPGDPENSELIEQVRSGSMPPTETGLDADQIQTLEQWIRKGALWPAPPVSDEQVTLAPTIDDSSFLRRACLDTVGIPPTADQTKTFLLDSTPNKRERLVDRLLEDERLADHWMGYWQDLLAENPTLLNQSLNSTGPFRWFLYDSLRDHKPIDRLITELLLMRGSPDTGGSAGFALAGENDAPFAAKAHIASSAFLGVELQCARCHDSPYHSTTQRDLYSLAAMLERKKVKVPATSRVPDAFFEKTGRESLIKVTLKPDETIAPIWPLAGTTGVPDDSQIDSLMINPDDSRERLAALITAPQNLRFGRVIVNRVWKRLIGAGLVEPVHDWEGQTPSHPELLDALVLELISEGYDLRQVMRRIMTSKVYMREATGNNLAADSQQRFFAAPDRRRMTAEQIVDSLHVVTGNAMDSEELTFVHDGQRPVGQRQTLGKPRRSWMFASLSNERDRPSLSLPKARTITDVLQAFGWNGSRQQPCSQRDRESNVLQPGVLANGSLTMTLTRASLQSELAILAIDAKSPESLIDTLFLRILTRYPRPDERATFTAELAKGFEGRVRQSDISRVSQPERLPLVTWFNHLQPEANNIQLKWQRRVKAGPAFDPRIDPVWRATYEDFVWSLVNHREFVWIP